VTKQWIKVAFDDKIRYKTAEMTLLERKKSSFLGNLSLWQKNQRKSDKTVDKPWIKLAFDDKIRYKIAEMTLLERKKSSFLGILSLWQKNQRKSDKTVDKPWIKLAFDDKIRYKIAEMTLLERKKSRKYSVFCNPEVHLQSIDLIRYLLCSKLQSDRSHVVHNCSAKIAVIVPA